ncbi:MAG TPA: class I SAM-dependent methyltransferase [Anaerolineales bacterium]|nr:class I SAM-dependent methyltransferase [Anaerolineales bacterium]
MMQGQATVAQNQPYILGHTDTELDRLIKQSQFYGDLTTNVLHLAGLKPGMQALDIGCGAGDVSFLAAKLVGPEGKVVGVDKSPEALALAARRASSARLMNVQFMNFDLLELSLAEPVDALIGRLVLMYFPDPAAMLRRLLNFVKPGGIVAFQEMDMDASKSEPACELFETSLWRIKQTFTRADVDIRTSLRLGRIFEEAGLPAPQMIGGTRVESGPDSPAYEQVTEITRTLLPLMERTGVATAEEVGIETLAARLREETVTRNATLVSPAMIGAWAQKV